MNCRSILYSEHAIKQMFAREIATEDVEMTLAEGEIIVEYPNDKPYPSLLILYFVNEMPIHVVVAKETKGDCIVVTAYRPDIELWDTDFRTKKK